MQGRIPEALAEVAKAVDLDPLDPVNHFTLGSGLGGIGGMTGGRRSYLPGNAILLARACLGPRLDSSLG